MPGKPSLPFGPVLGFDFHFIHPSFWSANYAARQPRVRDCRDQTLSWIFSRLELPASRREYALSAAVVESLVNAVSRQIAALQRNSKLQVGFLVRVSPTARLNVDIINSYESAAL